MKRKPIIRYSKLVVLTATFLMPESVIISLKIPSNISLKQFKELAMKEFRKQNPNFSDQTLENLTVMYINKKSLLQEISDHVKFLRDIDYFLPIFRFVVRDYSVKTEALDNILSRFNYGANKLWFYGAEIANQREELVNFCYDLFKDISELSFAKKLTIYYSHPLKKICSLSAEKLAILTRSKQSIIYLIFDDDNEKSIISPISISTTISINDLKILINERMHLLGYDIDLNNYLIKYSGRSLFFTGELVNDKYFNEETKLLDYPIIQEMVCDREIIPIMLVNKNTVEFGNFCSVTSKRNTFPSSSDQLYSKLAWDLDDSVKFRLTIYEVEIGPEITHFAFIVGLFYGEELLEPIQESKVLPCTHNFELGIPLSFISSINELPVNTKICISFWGCTTKSSSAPKLKSMTEMAWVNINLYDQNEKAYERRRFYYMYGTPMKRQVSSLYPLGTTIPPLVRNKAIKITCAYSLGGTTICYPSVEQIKEMIERKTSCGRKSFSPKLSNSKFFRNVSNSLTLNELSHEDKEDIWNHCEDYLQIYPNLLLKVMSSIPNFSVKSMIKLHGILQSHPKLDHNVALELLRTRFCHPWFRNYLVHIFKSFSDETLELYLPQIVQSLRVERHIVNEMTLFLLQRAAHNRRFAHYFIWHLMSGYENEENHLRYAIIIEAYFKHNEHHYSDMNKQVGMLNKLNEYTKVATINNVVTSTSLLDLFQNFIKYSMNSSSFFRLSCPLDPCYHLKKIILGSCSIMQSKKRPILLVFDTGDLFSKPVKMLYKYGDDLRQDALVLQSFKVVSALCEQFDPEIKFTCYNVISTGKNEGMIQLVQDATTLAKIQAIRGYNPDVIYKWYVDSLRTTHNDTSERILEGCKRFASTCAAYSVMTYILGIGDRHNDNIMIHKSGRLFHIDFGHILGNFKKFWGINRERTPFIMTRDFLYFSLNSKNTSENINRYKEYCSELFVYIRQAAFTVVIPYLLMTDVELPELNNEDDVKYILTALDFTLDSGEAKETFVQKFTTAIEKSWSTMINFKAHNMRIANATSSSKRKKLDMNSIKLDI